jgi:hypothetical protein
MTARSSDCSIYHASIAGRFLPVRGAGGRSERKRLATQRGDSAGSVRTD